MTEPSLSSLRWSKSAALLTSALAALLLHACGPFRFSVRSDRPSGIDAVFVIFGDEEGFAGKTASADIAPLIAPTALDNCFGHVEYAVGLTAGSAEWTKRSVRLEAMGMDPPTIDQGRLGFAMPKSNLSSHPKLAIAVIVRTTDRQYRLKVWQHAAIENAPGVLEIDVGAGAISANF